ncbi:MAG: hypothetical protein GY873_00060, partial [Bosea sp.]|nr:hypothetical protein [Bosea sp. (in: a-proteobacteria)]
AQLQALRLAGCSHLQGYYLARPMDAEDALLLAQRGYIGDVEPVEAELGNGTHG